MKFKVGDRVRINIPKNSGDGPGFIDTYNHRHGKITQSFRGGIYRIEFLDPGDPAEAVWRDIDLVLAPNGVQEMIKCL